SDLADGAPVDVGEAGVEHAEVVETLGEEGQAAGGVDIGGDEATARLEVGEDRGARRDAVEVVEVEAHPGLGGDREKMKDSVCRTAAGSHARDGVLECF